MPRPVQITFNNPDDPTENIIFISWDLNRFSSDVKSLIDYIDTQLAHEADIIFLQNASFLSEDNFPNLFHQTWDIIKKDNLISLIKKDSITPLPDSIQPHDSHQIIELWKKNSETSFVVFHVDIPYKTFSFNSLDILNKLLKSVQNINFERIFFVGKTHIGKIHNDICLKEDAQDAILMTYAPEIDTDIKTPFQVLPGQPIKELPFEVPKETSENTRFVLFLKNNFAPIPISDETFCSKELIKRLYVLTSLNIYLTYNTSTQFYEYCLLATTNLPFGQRLKQVTQVGDVFYTFIPLNNISRYLKELHVELILAKDARLKHQILSTIEARLGEDSAFYQDIQKIPLADDFFREASIKINGLNEISGSPTTPPKEQGVKKTKNFIKKLRFFQKSGQQSLQEELFTLLKGYRSHPENDATLASLKTN